MSDAECLALLRVGDLSALEPLVVAHGDRAQRLAIGILRDRSLAEDVVADSFLALVDRSRRFDPSRPFRPWFDRIVVNRALNVARNEQRRRRLASILGRMQESADPAVLAERGELREALRQAFSRLAPRDRAVVTLRLVLEATEQETAEALGCPVGTVKSRLARARRQLVASLGHNGLSDPRGSQLGEQP